MLTILRCLETWRLESNVSRGVVRKARTSKAGDDGMIWPSTDVWLITMSNPSDHGYHGWTFDGKTTDLWTCAFWLFFFVVFHPSQIRKLSVLGLFHFTANFKVQPQLTKILFAKAPFHSFRSCRQSGRFPRCKSLGWHVIVAAAAVAAVVRRCILQTRVTRLDTWESKHCCILNRFDQSTWHGDKGQCFSSSSSRLGVKQGKVSDQARYEGRDSRADSWRDGLLQKPLRCFDCVC